MASGRVQRRLGASYSLRLPLPSRPVCSRGKGTGYTERKIKISVMDDSSPNCLQLLIKCNANGFGEEQQHSPQPPTRAPRCTDLSPRVVLRSAVGPSRGGWKCAMDPCGQREERPAGSTAQQSVGLSLASPVNFIQPLCPANQLAGVSGLRNLCNQVIY